MNSETLYFFLDARSLIDHSFITDIPWNDEFGHTNIVLVICHPVIRELYRIKNNPGDIRSRKRVSHIIKNIYYLAKEHCIVSINQQTKLMLLLDDLHVGRTECTLQTEGPYCRLLTSIVCFNHENKILITSDPVLKAAAILENIQCASLPEKYLIDQRHTQISTNFQTLQNRIYSLEKDTPDLEIFIVSDAGEKQAARFMFHRNPEFSEDTIREKTDALRSSLEFKVSGENTNRPSDAEIARYQQKLNHYIEGMSRYFKDSWEHQDRCSRTAVLKFILENTGSVPVDDIRIYLHFPDGFILTDNPAHFKEPEAPLKPEPPRSQEEMLEAILNFRPADKQPIENPSLVKNSAQQFIGPVIRATHSYDVRYRIQRLQPGLKYELKPFYLLFRSYKGIKPFKAEYSIAAANTSEPLQGDIPFDFELY